MAAEENSRLVDQTLSTGEAVISEFPLKALPTPQNFPTATASPAEFRSEF